MMVLRGGKMGKERVRGGDQGWGMRGEEWMYVSLLWFWSSGGFEGG